MELLSKSGLFDLNTIFFRILKIDIDPEITGENADRDYSQIKSQSFPGDTKSGGGIHTHSADIGQIVSISIEQAECISDVKTGIIRKIVRIYFSGGTEKPGAIVLAVDKGTGTQTVISDAD